MVSIKSINQIVSYLTKVAKTSSNTTDKAMYNFFEKMTCGYGKDASPYVYKGENLENLPDFIKPLLSGLKKPSVVVNGRSRVKGQGILGLAIKDGNRTIGTSAISLDRTMGEPILQMRGNFGNGSQKAVSFNTLFNTNLSGSAALKGDVFVNKRLAKEVGISDEVIEGMSRFPKSLSSREIDMQAQGLRFLFAGKGNLVRSIDECLPEFVKIASKTGKVTKKSAAESVEAVLSEMGYNPKNVKLNFSGKNTPASGSFNMFTGELELNLNHLRNHQDLTDILSHELTHMEDFIMLYRQVGAQEFEKLVGGSFNKKWYDKMSKYITGKHFAFESRGKLVKITTNDGEITDPKLIKEFLKHQPKTPRFDVDTMKKELKMIARKEKSNFSEDYAWCKNMYDYINSSIEKHARQTEQQLMHKLQEAGIYRKTSISNIYGKEPGDYPEDFSAMFRQIDNALGKYGKGKNQKFNELYSQSVYTIDAELAEIHSAIIKGRNNGMSAKEVAKLCKKYDDIVKQRYSTEEKFELKILQEMQQKLGLQEIPVGKSLYLQALSKIDPELGQIQQTLFKGLPKSEFESLLQKQKEIIESRYKNKSLFDSMVSAEMDKIRRTAVFNNS